MGSRNPDRVPLSMRRARCETVADMRAERWDVLSKCRDCGLLMRVDLDLIIKVSGPRVSLWNRKARCRRIGCCGWVDFQARAPGMNGHDYLRADDQEGALSWGGKRLADRAGGSTD